MLIMTSIEHTSIAAGLVPAPPLPADENPALVYLASLAPGSRRTMQTALNTIAALLGVPPVVYVLPGANGRPKRDVRTFQDCPWHALRYQHTIAIRSLLAERYRPATANKLLAALRRVLLESRRLGLLSPDDYTRATDIADIKATTLPPGRALSAGELTALMSSCSADVTPAGVRDAALIALLSRGGLRRSEVVALTLMDYVSDTGALTVRAGKGRVERTTYLDGGSAAAVVD